MKIKTLKKYMLELDKEEMLYLSQALNLAIQDVATDSQLYLNFSIMHENIQDELNENKANWA